MKTFYISLVRDLIGCYLVATADSEMAVRYYLSNEYGSHTGGEWKLPWCSIYEEAPTSEFGPVTLIHSKNMQGINEADEKLQFEYRALTAKASANRWRRSEDDK